MYVRLDTVQPQLEQWIKESYKKGKWSPNTVINTDAEIIDKRLKDGMRPSPVTRDLTWGVPVPLKDEKDEDGVKGKVLCKHSNNLSS
jgi:methionyl-tRNA synthetase